MKKSYKEIVFSLAEILYEDIQNQYREANCTEDIYVDIERFVTDVCHDDLINALSSGIMVIHSRRLAESDSEQMQHLLQMRKNS